MFTINGRKSSLFGLAALCMLVVCLLTSCASVVQTAPGWVLNPSDGYPESEYMTAVGYASNRQTAEENAKAELTKIIRQTVQSEVVATEYIGENHLSEKEIAWEKARSIDTYVRTTSELTVTGIVIQDVYITSETVPVYYALALIDRDDVGQIYKNRAIENETVINAKIAAANKEKGPISRFKIMQDAAMLATENQDNLDMLAVINKDMRKALKPAYGNAAAVEELARQALDEARVYIDVRGDDSGRVAAAFARRIQDAGFKTVEEYSVETAAITLSVDVSLSPLDMESANKYVRYVLTGSLIENSTGKEMETYSTNGREAHVTEAEARARALRTLEQYVNNLDLLSDLQ